MSALIVALLIGVCIGAVLLAFVLMLLDNGRLRGDVARLKGERNTALDARRAAEAALADVSRQLDQARHELENYTRSGNRLYREAMEDQQARTLQAALLLKNARRDVDDAYRVLNQQENK